MFKTEKLVYIAVAALVVLYLFPNILGNPLGGEGYADIERVEQFCGGNDSAGSGHQHAPDCDGSADCGCGSYAGSVYTGEPENFSSCYRKKQIYLSSCDPDSPTSHADVTLERRWGKMYVNIQANLPYALGGVFNTMWGAYHAYLVDTKTNRSINIGSLVRHGDRFYKLATELLGEYSNYDQMWIYRNTEDYKPKLVLRGKIRGSGCSSL